MVLNNETIVGIVTLFLMCFLPYVRHLIRSLRRRRTKPAEANAITIDPIFRPDNLASLESGMLYATRSVRVETFMLRSNTVPDLHWTFYHRGSDLDRVNNVQALSGP
ncbi:hypothetical protein M426DRAFT_111299 [Hypoxylon sp. CI-4A]|nr:hypothetical protein M426DRAFT_111299 [Hypoxylon sp. CI-4A]